MRLSANARVIILAVNTAALLIAVAAAIHYRISRENLRAELDQMTAALKTTSAELYKMEYILQSINIQTAQTETLGAFHGIQALSDCEAEANALIRKTGFRAWCVKGK